MRRLAAIDIGTNSVLLLVARVDESGDIIPVQQKQIITRLGKGVQERGEISPETMRSTLSVVRDYWETSLALGAERVVICGTDILRRAVNGEEFLRGVKEATGLRVEVLSQKDEARWSYLGALSNKKDLKGKTLVMDIGGGSTEFIWGQGDQIEGIKGLDVGCVRATERFVTTDPISKKDLSRLGDFIRNRLKLHLPSGISHLVGVGGTITTLAAIDQRMGSYQPQKIDGYILKLENLHRILQELITKPLEERRRIPGLEPERADIILAGALILKEAMETLGFRQAVVSDRGLRFGLILREIRRRPSEPSRP